MPRPKETKSWPRMLCEGPRKRTTCKSIRFRKIIWSTIKAQSARVTIRRAPRIWTWSRGWPQRRRATLVSISPTRSTSLRKLEERIATAQTAGENLISEWKRWHSYSQDSKVRQWWMNPLEAQTCRSKRLWKSINEVKTRIPTSCE